MKVQDGRMGGAIPHDGWDHGRARRRVAMPTAGITGELAAAWQCQVDLAEAAGLPYPGEA